jgi:hypothetical protein
MQRFERQGVVEFLKHTFLAWIAALIFGALVLLFVALLFLFAAQPSLGAEVQYPVTIPAECVELAQREGHPIIIENKKQGALAKAKLWRLSDRDPLVKQCREAVKAAEKQ